MTYNTAPVGAQQFISDAHRLLGHARHLIEKPGGDISTAERAALSIELARALLDSAALVHLAGIEEQLARLNAVSAEGNLNITSAIRALETEGPYRRPM